jgi:hypothetical protein
MVDVRQYTQGKVCVSDSFIQAHEGLCPWLAPTA